MGRLDGRVALVTGASRGIGAAIAAGFAAEGACVAASARTVTPGTSRLPGTLEDTVGGIRAAGGTAEAFAADLSVPQDRERLVEQVHKRCGEIDILVNNAAVTYFTPVAEFTARRQALMFEVQVTAPTHLAQLVIPGMRERGRGWILNISSVAARHPAIPPGPRAGLGGTVYGMCKAALERLSTGLAAELYADGIAVNSLAPTKVVPTPGTLFHHLTTEDDPNAEPPEVMAAAALALCQAPPSELTGRIAYSQELLAELGLTV
ncbi:SDR family NAD(P)-dependent oxidoreductase [Nonomuraea sp. K274]|uniref:SDR family NAD(P)-dependent oxidoreductase n=1 Tax=Nonomuraea cypriaca TaxID=1187855 RepID=A0A931A2Z5_9ACTN|nr:SDR family NAD(P)-dependent oxidoreductase [Nonomuraea cypriaca]MBF8185292.1 SDR family NAD(P)-dependent oxidoreductase [Nonomuraea cypriaca]